MFLLRDLPTWQIQALEWFELNAGREFAKRPFDVGLPIKVTSAQKGIWKPAHTSYAVSVVQTSKGIYADQDPIFGHEGNWEYYYHQEGKSPEDLSDPYRLYSNAGLFRCMVDGIPVGVVIPAASGRGYQVLGLALVADYDKGLFRLDGPVSVGAGAGVAVTGGTVSVSLIDFADGGFDPNAEEDSRLKVLAQVSRRQGAPRFRRALLQADRRALRDEPLRCRAGARGRSHSSVSRPANESHHERSASSGGLARPIRPRAVGG